MSMWMRCLQLVRHPAGTSTAAALALILFSAGCQGPALRSSRAWREPPAASAPTWVGQPLSWDKLQAIETWLVGVGPDQEPQRVPQAELELAEGRLVLARREAASLSPSQLAIRLGASEAGFRRVLSKVDASSLDRQRARDGLNGVRALRSGESITAATAKVAPALSANLHPRAEWGASRANPARLTRHMGTYSRVTIHHSAKHTRDIGNTAGSYREAIQKIQKVHMRDRNFGDIGYHFLIDPDGRIYRGRSLDFQGAHASGNNNVRNLGVCLLGNFVQEQPTSAALRSLELLLAELRGTYGIPTNRVYGHMEFTATQCPGTLIDWVKRYRARPNR